MNASASRSSHALFPGTFDPPTLGHVDIARRAASMFGKVTIAIASHPSKQAMFTAEERLALWREVAADIEGAEADILTGLVVDGCARWGATVLVRGVRTGTDFDYEVQMARMNRTMLPRIDTVLLAPDPAYGHVTGTLVRQIASLGGDVSPFVPAPVVRALRRKVGSSVGRST